MNILLTLILFANLAILAAILTVFIKVRRVYADFRAFVSPCIDEEGKPVPSPLAIIVNSLADQAVRNGVGYLKASFMGKKSGEVRADEALQTDLQLDLASAANPLIGQVLNGIPALRRLAKKNPGLIDLALSRMNLGGNGHSPVNQSPAPDARGNGQARFKLGG